MLNFRVSIRLFSFGNRKGLCRYLEKMAAKGWMPEKFLADGLWLFRRIPPTTLKYALFYARPAKPEDTEALVKQEEFYELCAHDGWELICTNAWLQIFCNRRPDPVPLETDPVAELERFHAAYLRVLIPTWIVLIASEILSIWREIQSYHRNLNWQDRLAELGIYREADIGQLFIRAASRGLLIACILVNIAEYFSWHRRAEQAAREGRESPSISRDFPGLPWLCFWRPWCSFSCEGRLVIFPKKIGKILKI